MTQLEKIKKELSNEIQHNNIKYHIDVYGINPNPKRRTLVHYIINWISDSGELLYEKDLKCVYDPNKRKQFTTDIKSIRSQISEFDIEEEEAPQGRPTKLTPQLIDAMEKVIYGDLEGIRNPDEINEDESEIDYAVRRGKRALYLTINDLVFLLNLELERMGHKELCVSQRVFERYIANFVNRTEKYYVESISPVQQEIVSSFSRLIKINLLNQKIRLMETVENKSVAWQRFSWILERKFEEMNLKTVGSLDLTNKGDKFDENKDLSNYTVDQLREIKKFMLQQKRDNNAN